MEREIQEAGSASHAERFGYKSRRKDSRLNLNLSNSRKDHKAPHATQ